MQTNQDSNDITNYQLFERLVKISDLLQLIKDTQHDHGKKLDQLSAAVFDLNEDVAHIVERSPDE